MTRISIRTFLRAERQRLRAWLSGPPESLDSVETVRTVGDCIDADSVRRRLPVGWHVQREIVQFPGESLAEVVRLTSPDGYRITLKPVELHAPTETIELYTRASPRTSRRHRTTAGSLSAAVTTATEIAAARKEASRQSASQSTAAESSKTDSRLADSF